MKQPPPPDAPAPPNHSGPAEYRAAADAEGTPRDVGYERTAWRELLGVLEVLFAGAREFHGAVTVADALELDLAELASDLGIGPATYSHKIEDLTDVQFLDGVIDEIRDLRATTAERNLAIIEQYLFARSRTTLQELADTFGVSRQRIGQVKIRVVAEVERRVGREISVMAATLARRAGPVVREDDLRLLLDGLFEDEPEDDPAVDLARRMIETTMGYDSVAGICAIGTAGKVLDRFRDRAVELADEVGLIDEEALRESLPDAEWHRLFELAVERSGVVRIGGRLALRSTKRARAKAAILDIGRPATLEEIVAESGLPRNQLGGLLSGIPGVARATKSKWGVEEWIEDEYEGIVAEIIQRIEEDGGATTMDRLIRELPGLFEVKEGSVRSLVATPQFVLHNGLVRMASDSEVTLRDIREVADGVTAEGWPYWGFRVHERYFAGYSLAGVPPEIADALGCPKNGSIRAVVTRPAGCGPISVNWQLTSTSGASVGYISKPLVSLGVAEGDLVRLVIVEPGVAEFRSARPERDGD